MCSRRVAGVSALSGVIAFAIVAVGCATAEGRPRAEIDAAPPVPPSTLTTTSTTVATLPPTITRPSTLSPDDANRWRRVDLAPQIASGSLVATGPRGTVVFGAYALGNSPGTSGWFSADGSNWAPIEGLQRMIDGGDHSFDSGWGWVTALAASDSGFVAVGVHVTFPDPQSVHGGAAAWSSPDGRNWTRVGTIGTLAGDQIPIALVRGAGAFLALASPTTDKTGPPTLGPVTAWRSADGQNWQRVTIDQNGYGKSIAATSFGFVATGVALSFSPLAKAILPAIWISADGINWRRVNTDVFHSAPSLIASIHVVAYRDGAALIARQFESENFSDNAMTIMMTTTDGVNWRSIDSPPCLTATRRDYLVDFAASEDRLVVLASIGDIPPIITGTHDGAQWRCVRVDPVAFPTTAWGPVDLLRLTANRDGTFTIIGGTTLEPGNKPNFHAAIWTENR